MLVMKRNKFGSEYFTLVGGRLNEGETPEQGLVREIYEETGMTIVAAQLVYIEKHHEPYNEQYIYLCEAAPHEPIAVQHFSEEGQMNQQGANTHHPQWIPVRTFHHLPFRTPSLQDAIVKAFKKGFPKKPLTL